MLVNILLVIPSSFIDTTLVKYIALWYYLFFLQKLFMLLIP